MVKKCCDNCEFCMGKGVCASGYDKKEGKEPYYGEECYTSEFYEKMNNLKPGEELYVENNPQLSDKFPDGCPFWEVSITALNEMNDEEIEECDPDLFETILEIREDEERAARRAKNKLDKLKKEYGKGKKEFKA